MVEPPRGMYPGRLDEKGRVKLPTAFQQFFAALREKTLFVTSMDRRIAQIYTLQRWREAEKFFSEYREDPELARKVAFNAADLGAETEMDGQGRILFSPELRRELGIEGQPVRIFAYRGRLEVLSEKIYEERRREAAQISTSDIDKLERAGLP
jgi:MraZ protein